MVSWVAQERAERVSLRGSSFEVQLFASDVGVNCCSMFVEFFEHLYVVRHRVAAKLFTRGLWAKNGVNRKKKVSARAVDWARSWGSYAHTL